MQELTDQMTKLCRALLVLGPLGVVLGFPPLWVAICSLMVLDISSIALVTTGSSSGDSGLRQSSCRQHHEVVARAPA